MNSLRILVTWFFIFIAAGVGFLLVSPELPLPIHTEVKIVKSGSMEPTIMTGAAVLIVERDSYGIGDVVTFKSESASIPTTHRIIASETHDGTTVFVTKGDANEESDTAPLLPENIIGKVLVDVPYLGFIFDFARQPIGFALLIGIPALLIIIDEVEKIYRELRRKPARVRISVAEDLSTESVALRFERPLPRTARVVDMCRKTTVRAIGTPVVAPRELGATPAPYSYERFSFGRGAVVASFVLFMGAVAIIGGTVAFGHDTEQAVGNTLAAGAVDFTLTPNQSNLSFTGGVPDGSGVIDFTLATVSSADPLRYALAAEVVSGSPSLCAGIETSAAAPFVYSGALANLSVPLTSLPGSWSLPLTLAPSTVYSSGDTCVIALNITGWHEDFDLRYGHYDEERVLITVTAVAAEPIVAPFSALSIETPLPDSTPESQTEEATTEEVGEETTEPEPIVTDEPAPVEPEVEPIPEPEPAPEPTIESTESPAGE